MTRGMLIPTTFPSEEAFTNFVVDLFIVRGWLVHHDMGKMQQHIQGHKGFPDICASAEHHLVMAELKMPGKLPTLEQTRWLQSLALGPAEVHIWYPKDMPEIFEVAARR